MQDMFYSRKKASKHGKSSALSGKPQAHPGRDPSNNKWEVNTNTFHLGFIKAVMGKCLSKYNSWIKIHYAQPTSSNRTPIGE